jgi:hypothetical protein
LIFLLIDVLFGLSIRITFLDAHIAFKMVYYGFCMACFLSMVWKPKLTVLIGAVESLVTLVALIIVMGLRVMVPTDRMLEAGAGFVTMPELLNFIIAGSIAYVAWSHGLRALHRT